MSRTESQLPEPNAKRNDESITMYYTTLTDEEVREQVLWGDFALAEFPDESG